MKKFQKYRTFRVTRSVIFVNFQSNLEKYVDEKTDQNQKALKALCFQAQSSKFGLKIAFALLFSQLVFRQSEIQTATSPQNSSTFSLQPITGYFLHHDRIVCSLHGSRFDRRPVQL